ncbi:hypothetical protein Val02_10770 [Virgisporangium aliadipatigenens]|uniref:Sulfotransferase n=1 Tax=Virgisporangium aliadipatigenens TaxID=741659 RepID=A0A8J3YFR5_9ACTN|nr:sulfotransferase [Virgisporangium aliadipatigenens]GIJ44191.1 hypothetical protein Val02_10770 [Virgisporangium aliadipatigenens]
MSLAAVIGTGRCGSSLVQELLCRHPSTGFVSGLDDKLPRLNLTGRWNGALYRRSAPRPSGMTSLSHSRRLLERGRLRVAPSEAYALLERHVCAGYGRPCRDLLAADLTPHAAARLRSFVDDRLRAQRCDLLLQHVTGWPRTGWLRTAFPRMKVVNVVRDGRAVAASWLRMGWWDGWRGPDAWIYGPLPADLRREWEESGRSFVVLAGLGWRMLTDAATAARAAAPEGSWLDVRYEDLIAEPRKETARMLEFLGLEWTPAFERGFARYRFEQGRREAWRDELSPAQIAELERTLDSYT